MPQVCINAWKKVLQAWLLWKNVLQAQKVVTLTTVSISETFDLKTRVGSLGLIGIHTPNSQYIDYMYDGLRKNHKFLKLLKCDIVFTCASTLPADPLQVGETANKIAPQDMFNPILYKAVTNESFETIVNRMYGLNDFQSNASVASVQGATSGTSATAQAVYYGLLAQDGWRKAMVQEGFTMRDVRPLCHSIVSSFGNTIMLTSASSLNQIPTVNAAGDTVTNTSFGGTVFRGPAMPMPRIPCSRGISVTDAYQSDSQAIVHNATALIPKTYVACIVVPPAVLNVMYFRMRVTWTIQFQEVIPSTLQAPFAYTQGVGLGTHYSNYQIDPDEAKNVEEKFEKLDSVVDFDGTDAESIMVN